jgi:hypothetical protein
MSEPESFLARWARLKQASGVAASSPGEVGVGKSVPEAASPGPAAFDPAALPTIESITCGTDIEQFLQPGVPTELTRAALRAAWVADPAIRDFIGIADSQWDFNDPTAMPGFGPLQANESARSSAERTVARINETPETIARMAGAAAQPAADTANLPREGQVDNVWLSSGMTEQGLMNVATDRPPPEQGNVISEMEQHPGGRVHGSALPKLAR